MGPFVVVVVRAKAIVEMERDSHCARLLVAMQRRVSVLLRFDRGSSSSPKGCGSIQHSCEGPQCFHLLKCTFRQHNGSGGAEFKLQPLERKLFPTPLIVGDSHTTVKDRLCSQEPKL